MNLLASPVNRAILIGLIAVVIGLFSYFSVVQPALTQYAQSNDRLQQDITTYNNLKAVADQKPTYIALTKQIQVELKNVIVTADPRVYIPSYLKQIEALAKQDGLQITSVTPQATPSPAPGASPAPGSAAVPQSVSGIPAINSAKTALGAEGAQSQVTQNVAATTGGTAATPVPGQVGTSASGISRQGGPGVTGASNTARANAIAYLNQDFSQVPINMELSGTYQQLEKFLRDLNGFQKLIGVGNLTMTPATHQDVGETPTLNIILPIVAYRLSPSYGGSTGPGVPGPASPVGAGGNGG
jgi:Tfp pilus assembly protein PilO